MFIIRSKELKSTCMISHPLANVAWQRKYMLRVPDIVRTDIACPRLLGSDG